MNSTISPDEAATRTWDCVVIGAGPAGALAAREMARRGTAVLLVDKAQFPRYKVCGCCLNPRSLGTLDSVGLGGLVSGLGGLPLTSLCLGAGKTRARLPIPQGMAVSRNAFDAALIHEAIASGAQFFDQASATIESVADPNRVVRLRRSGGEYSVNAKMVVAANGLVGNPEAHATPAEWRAGSRIGAGVIVEQSSADYDTNAIHMACGNFGYVGLVRIEGGCLNIAAALDPEVIKSVGGIGALAAAILDEAGFPAIEGLASLNWKGTPHLTRSASKQADRRLFVIGDAAGYVEPFTGEGMAWALATAKQVAPMAVQGCKAWSDSLIPKWEATYRRTVKKRQAVCKFTAALLRRPLATRTLVRLLALTPMVAWPAFRMMYRL